MPVEVTIPPVRVSTTLAITGEGQHERGQPGDGRLHALRIPPTQSIREHSHLTIVGAGPGAQPTPTPVGPPIRDCERLRSADSDGLHGPDHAAGGRPPLRVLTPTLLELRQLNTKAPDPATVTAGTSWTGTTSSPAARRSHGDVAASGCGHAVGFRRPCLRPLKTYDLRIDNALTCSCGAVADGQAVEVTNRPRRSGGDRHLHGNANPLRYSPAIHVNRRATSPLPEEGMIGYYLATWADARTASSFSVIDVSTDAVVFQGTLTLRRTSATRRTAAVQQCMSPTSAARHARRIPTPVDGWARRCLLINDGIAMVSPAPMPWECPGSEAERPRPSLHPFTHAADTRRPPRSRPATRPQFSFTWKRSRAMRAP